jgi:hypothetical protein
LSPKGGGNRFEESVAAAGVAFRPDLERIAGTLKARAIPMLVVEIPSSMGDALAGHVSEFFRARPDVCKGVLRVSFDHPENFIADWRDRAAAAGVRPDWVTRTGEELGIDEQFLAPHFPYRDYFQDIVHPNALGNELISAQLARFLAHIR